MGMMIDICISILFRTFLSAVHIFYDFFIIFITIKKDNGFVINKDWRPERVLDASHKKFLRPRRIIQSIEKYCIKFFLSLILYSILYYLLALVYKYFEKILWISFRSIVHKNTLFRIKSKNHKTTNIVIIEKGP